MTFRIHVAERVPDEDTLPGCYPGRDDAGCVTFWFAATDSLDVMPPFITGVEVCVTHELARQLATFNGSEWLAATIRHVLSKYAETDPGIVPGILPPGPPLVTQPLGPGSELSEAEISDLVEEHHEGESS